MYLALVAAVLSFTSVHVDAFTPSSPGSRIGGTSTVPKSKAGAVAIPADFSPQRTVDSKDVWVEKLDFEAFGKEVAELGKELKNSQGLDDVDHLMKIVEWRNIAFGIGVATMWLPVNPITVLALSTWTYASWTMIAHHTCHGGYNRVDAGNFNSRGFALGSVTKRVADWCDWMMPEAWNIEHNRLHHYHLGEKLDPDLVERNLVFLQEMDIAKPLKYGVAAALMPIWKWFYYAPNTFKELQIARMKSAGEDLPADFLPEEALTLKSMFFPEKKSEIAAQKVVDPTDFLVKVLGPFLVSRFVLLPAPLLFLPGGIGPSLFSHAIANLVLAELFTNVHGFITIVTNHAGNDIYKFDDEVRPKSASFYVRQIIGSTNYSAGTDAIDFSHGWLNYQIEHHVWPDFSMLQYQRGAPKLKAICEKHGVPYVQENVFTRLFKTFDVMVGHSTMREFPIHLEPAGDKARKGVTWKSTNGAIDEE